MPGSQPPEFAFRTAAPEFLRLLRLVCVAPGAVRCVKGGSQVI